LSLRLTQTLSGLTSISFWTERATVLLHVVVQLQQVFANVRANSEIYLNAEGKEFNSMIQLLTNFFKEDLGHDDLLKHYHPS
jgi:phosphotransferase system HPr-like phosphotransfer protein